MALLHLTDANFKKEVLESSLPVMVDFWAPWCGPCKMLTPAVEEAASEFDGKLRIGKINVDENSGAATQYGIMSIPALIFFKNGKVIGQVIGALSKADLKKKIEEFLK